MAKASVMRRVSFNLLRNQLPIFLNQDSQSFSTIPIKSNSRLPQQSHYRNQISIANLLQRYGFPSSLLHSFLSKNNRFLLQMNLKDMEKSLGILFNFKIPQNELVSLVCECPGVLDCQFLNKWEMSFSQLGLSTGSPSMVRSVLEHSRKYHLDPNNFFKTLVVLRGMGFNNATLSSVLEGFPEVTLMNESEIRRRVEFLMDGIPMSAEGVLGFGVEDRLKPLISEFKALGFDNDLISGEISRDPRILSMELGELSRVAILEKIYSEGEFRAGFEVKLRVDYFCKQGLTRREAFEVLWKEPRSIVYKMEDVEQKVDFLVNRMKFNIRCLLEVPEYVGVNFDKQIVPRFNVIEYLRSKDGLGSPIGLRALIKPSRLKFYNLYVKPYPECLKFFGRYSEDVEVKSQQPVGLWKILKPQSKPATKEDVENMKVLPLPLLVSLRVFDAPMGAAGEYGLVVPDLFELFRCCALYVLISGPFWAELAKHQPNPSSPTSHLTIASITPSSTQPHDHSHQLQALRTAPNRAEPFHLKRTVDPHSIHPYNNHHKHSYSTELHPNTSPIQLSLSPIEVTHAITTFCSIDHEQTPKFEPIFASAHHLQPDATHNQAHQPLTRTTKFNNPADSNHSSISVPFSLHPYARAVSFEPHSKHSNREFSVKPNFSANPS
ncbi:hypothetical protein F8388_011148 [Cannabis sativa]|uniref:Uncharacterized protein n=1 Tax=Cannabis sativa TaxID=3483 RepID=A0A7J6E813_CANSA|nr:hypothetical protein F8388_011148 [Cannabis sativa]